MYAVIRHFDKMRAVEEAGRRATAGLGPMLRKAAGFRGYHVVDCGDGAGMSISLFETRDSAEAAHRQALDWIRANLSDLTDSAPTVYAGEVVGSITADQATTSAAA